MSFDRFKIHMWKFKWQFLYSASNGKFLSEDEKITKNGDNLKIAFEWIVSISASLIPIWWIARFMCLLFCITHWEKSFALTKRISELGNRSREMQLRVSSKILSARARMWFSSSPTKWVEQWIGLWGLRTSYDIKIQFKLSQENPKKIISSFDISRNRFSRFRWSVRCAFLSFIESKFHVKMRTIVHRNAE